MRYLPLLLLLTLSMAAQDDSTPDPHEGKVMHCNNAYTTAEDQKCACNKTTTCPDPGAALPEDQKCKSYCYHGCGCVGPCTT